MTQVELLADQPFAAPGGVELLADVFLPMDGGQARPAILWLHGGGWRFGNRKLAPDLFRHFAERGYVMVSVDYRLSGRAIFPAALEDAKTAIRWVRSKAGEFGIDVDRIGLWGGSAGGHLAALCALTAPGSFAGEGFDDFSADVAAVCDCYGPSDFLEMDRYRDPEGKPSDDAESIQLPKGKHSADADSLESRFLGAPIETVPDRVKAANPASYVPSAGAICPFLLLHGMSDTAVPWQQSQTLYDALAAREADVTLGLVPGLGHGFTNRKALDEQSWEIEFRSPAGTTIREARIFELIGDWFDSHLRPGEPS